MSKTIQPFGRRLRVAPDGKKYSKHPKGDPNLETLSLVTTLIQVVEGNSATITVSRTGGTTGAVAVDWTVAEVTTTPQSGTLSWADGDGANKSASVLAALVVGNGSGSVTLSNPRRTDGGDEQPVLGVASGSITVLDDPGLAGTIALVTTAITVIEGENATLTASRTNGSEGAVAVDYTVTGVTTTPQSGSLAWATGDSANKNATLSAGLVNGNTTGAVTLSNARRTDGGSPAPLLGTSTGSLTVTDYTEPVVLASWNLPITLNVAQGSSVDIRQYALNADGLTLSVINLPAGVTYDAVNERLVAA